MIRKLIAIALAVLINGAVLALFNAWSTAAVADAMPPQRNDKLVVLPTVTVRPTPAQVEMLRQESSRAGGGSL